MNEEESLVSSIIHRIIKPIQSQEPLKVKLTNVIKGDRVISKTRAAHFTGPGDPPQGTPTGLPTFENMEVIRDMIKETRGTHKKDEAAGMG